MLAGEDILEPSVCQIEVEIKNSDGLHMRPAMQFVDISNQYDSDLLLLTLSTIDGINNMPGLDNIVMDELLITEIGVLFSKSNRNFKMSSLPFLAAVCNGVILNILNMDAEESDLI